MKIVILVWANSSNPRHKDTHRENTLSNKTQALRKSMNIDIGAIGTLNQLFKRGSYTQNNISKKQIS